jgi:hypothetical protein
VGELCVYDGVMRLLYFLEDQGHLSGWFIKVMYINNSISCVEFYPFFSFYAYIEFNERRLTLPFVNNVCYFDLDIV